MRNSLTRAFYRQTDNLIQNYGKNVQVVYHSVVPCIYCSTDPITGESISIYCATCNGTGQYETATSYYVRGIVNTFLNNTGFVLYGNEFFNIIPEGKARATFWLNDVLINDHSQTGPILFDSSDSLYVDNRRYVVKDYQRVGMSNVELVVVNAERKEKE